MQHGPFNKLPPLKQKAWTLLVQGVNLHHPAADALLRQFRFVPDARLDDLMISYATDGGGVGPHFDSYDVFLLQAHGQRRWRISAQEDLTLEEGVPLKILSNFQAEQEFVLEPGDMLYLPPQYAHDGVAIGECMTYSVGFRSPAYQELGESFLEFMMDTIDLPGRYEDPDLKATAKPAELPVDMVARIRDELNKIRFTDDDITIFLGEHLSEPKPSVFFEARAEELSFARFFQGAKNGAWRCIARRACCTVALTSSSMANPSRSIAATKRSWHDWPTRVCWRNPTSTWPPKTCWKPCINGMKVAGSTSFETNEIYCRHFSKSL